MQGPAVEVAKQSPSNSNIYAKPTATAELVVSNEGACNRSSAQCTQKHNLHTAKSSKFVFGDCIGVVNATLHTLSSSRCGVCPGVCEASLTTCGKSSVGMKAFICFFSKFIVCNLSRDAFASKNNKNRRYNNRPPALLQLCLTDWSVGPQRNTFCTGHAESVALILPHIFSIPGTCSTAFIRD